MASMGKEIATQVVPFVTVYTDGTIGRTLESPLVPSSPEDPETGVAMKDIFISENPQISARVYLPKLADSFQKLPILVYFHGGGFCFQSAFSFTESRCLKTVVSLANVVAVSVEYRLAPENPLPIAYEDCWAALQWVASHLGDENGGYREVWLKNNGDFDRVFLGGDSAGANIVHNVLMRAGVERLPGGVRISGAYMTHPYFWGSEAIGSEKREERDKILPHMVWEFVYPSAPEGIDNPMINPVGPGKPSLSQLGCDRLFVSVAGNDELWDRGIWYCEEVRKSGWKGELELVKIEDEDHAFHIMKYDNEKSKYLYKRLADFLTN